MSSRYKTARFGALLLAVATAVLVAAPSAAAATSDDDSVQNGGLSNPASTSLLGTDDKDWV
jgi:hypothetical protein